jgi:hypothetical protein
MVQNAGFLVEKGLFWRKKQAKKKGTQDNFNPAIIIQPERFLKAI